MIFFRILLLNQLLTQYIILNTFPHDMTSHPMSAAGERVSSTQKPVPERQHHPQVTHTQMQKRFKRNFCTYVTCHVFNRTEWETGRKQNLILISFIFFNTKKSKLNELTIHTPKNTPFSKVNFGDPGFKYTKIQYKSVIAWAISSSFLKNGEF